MAAQQDNNDRWTIRAVVVLLGLIAIVSLSVMGWLALDGKEIPEAIVALGSSSAGALSALLARTSIGGPAGPSVP